MSDKEDNKEEWIVKETPDGVEIEGTAVDALQAAFEEIDREEERLTKAAPDLIEALRLMNAFINDVAKSNPGWMGKLCLQDYGQMNEAYIKTSKVLTELGYDPREEKVR